MSNTNTLHPVLDVHDGTMKTYTGKKMDLQRPDPEMIDIRDIAKGLSNFPRFGGQTPVHYSVATHSIAVFALAPVDYKSSMAALLHDASEAYLGDVIKPLKILLGPVYAELENRWMEAIAQRFGLEMQDFEAIKPFDTLALVEEYEVLFSGEIDMKEMHAYSIRYGDPYETFLKVYSDLNPDQLILP